MAKSFISFLLLFFVCFNIWASGLNFSFIVDSDPQIGLAEQEQAKKHHVKQIVKFIKNSMQHCRGVLVPGDMVSECNKDSKSWDIFNESWIKPINQAFRDVTFDGRLYPCWGNHDGYGYNMMFDRGNKALKYIEKKFSKKRKKLHYAFDIENVRFINLGLYPSVKNYRRPYLYLIAPKWFNKKNAWQPLYKNKGVFDFLKNQLKSAGHSKPVVIFFHYNITGSYGSNWWSDKDKEAFLKAIRGYNIKAIFVGHWHTTNISIIPNTNNVPQIITGSNSYAVCSWNARNQTLQVSFRRPIDPENYEERKAWDGYKIIN